MVPAETLAKKDSGKLIYKCGLSYSLSPSKMCEKLVGNLGAKVGLLPY
jgi:hypothetical protein